MILQLLQLVISYFFDGSNENHVEWAKQHMEAKWILVKGSPLDLEDETNHDVYFDQQGNVLQAVWHRARASQGISRRTKNSHWGGPMRKLILMGLLALGSYCYGYGCCGAEDLDMDFPA